MPAQGVDLAKN